MEQSTSMLIGQPLKESTVTEEETEKEEEPPAKRKKSLPQVVLSRFSLFQFVFLNIKINVKYLCLFFTVM